MIRTVLLVQSHPSPTELGESGSLVRALANERISVTTSPSAVGSDVIFVVDETLVGAALAERTIVIGCRRGSAFDVVAQTGAAGAIEDVLLDYWSWGMSDRMRPWMAVRTSIATSPGWEVRVMHGPDIAIGSHPDDTELPSLVRRYVADVARNAAAGQPR